MKFERILTTALQAVPRSWKVFREAMTTWLLDKLWIKNLIRDELGIPTDKILFSEHHLSHAASAFFCSPFDEAAILTVDGVGEWATRDHRPRHAATTITLLREIRFPHSLGLLYSAFTAFLGFEVNEGEYKVMGMAPVRRAALRRQGPEARSRSTRDGSFWLDMDYFCFHHSTTQTYNQQVRRAVRRAARSRRGTSSPRARATRRTSATSRPNFDAHGASATSTTPTSPPASSRCTEEIVLSMARALHDETGLDQLCMAGGVALNSVANGRILRETPFKELYIQPAAGDGGGALGAALYAYHCVLGKPRTLRHGPRLLGQGVHARARSTTSCAARHRRTRRCARRGRAARRASSSSCAGGQVVGWFQGRFEWGPRALGARSIIADPRRADMKDIVNTKIKFREPFRPFAPSVLVEARRALLRPRRAGAALPGALHAVRRRREAGAGRRAAGDHARRRHGAPADRAQGPRARSTTADRALRPGDRRAGDPEHVLQPEGRADRHHAGEGAQHVHAQRHGRAGARQLRSSPRADVAVVASAGDAAGRASSSPASASLLALRHARGRRARAAPRARSLLGARRRCSGRG